MVHSFVRLFIHLFILQIVEDPLCVGRLLGAGDPMNKTDEILALMEIIFQGWEEGNNKQINKQT